MQSGADAHHLASLTGGGSQYGTAGAPLVCVSYRERCREEWPLAQRPAPSARCAFRWAVVVGVTTVTVHRT